MNEKIKEMFQRLIKLFSPNNKVLASAFILVTLISFSHYSLANLGIYLDIPLGVYHPEDPVCLGYAACITEWHWNYAGILISSLISYLAASVFINRGEQ